MNPTIILPPDGIPKLIAAIERGMRGCDKHRYPDKKSAVTAINNRTKGHQRNRPAQLRAYPCPRCNGWHLTHEERR